MTGDMGYDMRLPFSYLECIDPNGLIINVQSSIDLERGRVFCFPTGQVARQKNTGNSPLHVFQVRHTKHLPCRAGMREEFLPSFVNAIQCTTSPYLHICDSDGMLLLLGAACIWSGSEKEKRSTGVSCSLLEGSILLVVVCLRVR